jgi:hypothetical protein
MATFDLVARRQLGLLTHEQLTDLGWNRSAIERAVSKQELFTVRPRVVRVAGAAVSEEQCWLAAVLSSKQPVVVSHLTAARLHRFPKYPDPAAIDLLAVGNSKPRAEGVIGHRTISLPSDHATTVRKVLATSKERTFTDTCGRDDVDAFACARALVRSDRMFLVRLAKVAREVPPSGRRRSVMLREVLGRYVKGFDPGDSDPEFEIADLIERAGYPRPTMGIPVRTEGRKHRIDCGWSDLRAGFEYQSDQIAKHEDDAKLRRLKRAGWDIWPITSKTSAAEVLATVAFLFRTPLPHW